MLRESRLFDGVSDVELEILAQASQILQYKAGEDIFTEGDGATGFYIVASGQVKVFKLSAEGKEHLLHLFGKGEPLGEVAVFTGGRYPASAAAVKDTACLRLSRGRFLEIIEERPQLAMNMIATLSERLRRFTRLVEDLSLKEVSARLARYILDLSELKGGTDEISLDVTKGQLARSLGTVSETLSRTLGKMKAKGVIDVNGRTIRITDRQLLQDLADGLKL